VSDQLRGYWDPILFVWSSGGRLGTPVLKRIFNSTTISDLYLFKAIYFIEKLTRQRIYTTHDIPKKVFGKKNVMKKFE